MFLWAEESKQHANAFPNYPGTKRLQVAESILSAAITLVKRKLGVHLIPTLHANVNKFKKGTGKERVHNILGN